MNKEFFERLEALCSSGTLVQHDYLFELADRTAGILESEVKSWRPCSDSNETGGLLDFTVDDVEKLPVIVVPDLHARAYFIKNILKFNLTPEFLGTEESLTVFEALEQKKVRVICVGDLLHSEMRCRERWFKAQEEFVSGDCTGPAMTEEMVEGLNLLSAVMELKCAFPDEFHILKGNHENIMNVHNHGNYPFRKFANEGQMVRDFMEAKFGDDVLMVIFCFENALPLLAALSNAVISHAEPERAFSRQELINGMNSDEVILGLTWTENDAAVEGSVARMLDELTTVDPKVSPRYLGGHRPVKDFYLLRQKGLFVQIHNPEAQHIALIYKDKDFDPENDIVDVGE